MITKKTMKPPKKGFSAADYVKATKKATRRVKRNYDVVSGPAIQDYDQRASQVLNQRLVGGKKPKPMGMTYGTTKAGKGATRKVKRAK